MANLDVAADKAVHDAVDAFMEGRLTPEFSGETVFETKHSRYRLLDGVVFAAPDDALVGAELVGWLMETSRRSVVGSAWQPGARAVLVDRHRGRNIIVTSTTRLLHLEQAASNEPVTHQPVAAQPVAATLAKGWSAPPPPPVPQAAFAGQWGPIIPATPLPPQVSGGSHGLAQDGGYADPSSHLPQTSPIHAAAQVQKRAAVHLPPRPIVPTPFPTPTPLPIPARPLPFPVPPPRRDGTPLPLPTMGQAPIAAVPWNEAAPDPGAGAAWELTSSEFEIDADTTDDGGGYTPHHDATHHPQTESLDASTDELPGGPESGTDAPIPLVRTLDPSLGGPPYPRR